MRVAHKGHATPAGTHEFASRTGSKHHADHLGKWTPGKDGELVLSSLGIGTYLGEVNARTDEAVINAVIYSVMNGWNVIDTASNYRSGRAEVSVGHALDAIIAGTTFTTFARDAKYAQDVTRDMLFISTKAGFFDPQDLKPLLKDGRVSIKDVVSNMHCMAPACILQSFETSRRRLNLDTVDLLYLHNAGEMQLPAVGRPTFMARLRAAFVALEKLREAGSLRYYGLATWTSFRVQPTDATYMSLHDVVNLAIQAAHEVHQGKREHGFRFVQLPINAAMPEAFKEEWQTIPLPPAPPSPPPPTNAPGASGSPAAHASAVMPAREEALTLMAAAQRLGGLVFASGPLLEAELAKRLVGRLDHVVQLRNQRTTAQKLLQFARSTPGLVSALVGHKTREFVVENVELSQAPLLSKTDFIAAYPVIQAVVKQQ